MNLPSDVKQRFHDIENSFTIIETFVQYVDSSDFDPDLKALHAAALGKMEQLKDDICTLRAALLE